MDNKEVADRVAIHDLMSRFNVAGGKGDLQALSQTFAENGILITPFARLESPAGIVKGMTKEFLDRSSDQRPDFILYNITTSQIDLVSPDEAKGCTYFIAITQIGIDYAGFYNDRFIKQNGQWRIAKRDARVNYVAPNSIMMGPHRELIEKQNRVRQTMA